MRPRFLTMPRREKLSCGDRRTSRSVAAYVGKSGRTINAAIKGAATKIADRCACTAHHASSVVTAIFHLGGVSPRPSAIAVAILTSAAATGGFQITDEIAMSNGAEAIVRHIASDRNGPTRRQS